MNSWIGMGRLTRDPQVRNYGEGNDKTMARFTIACDRRMRREEGQQNADFIGIVCYGKLAEFTDKYLRQGTKITMRGHIQSGSYTAQDGQKVYTTDVIADEIEFAESKGASNSGNVMQASTTPATVKAQPDGPDGFMHIADGIDEELPFN